MKRVLVVLAVVMGLALVTSVYAQKWDSAMEAQNIAMGKPFKFTGEILSIDPKVQISVIKVGNKTYTGRTGFAKYEGEYATPTDLKVGDMVSGEGVVINGENWVTKVRKAAPGASAGVGPKKD